jgi:DMSO/TMAO reductase YedYZ molybdopterin-dependent catalytic subunit
MKNVKWITRIELVSTDFQGYWQRGGWSDPAIIKTMARIDVARGGAAGKSIVLAGVAFAGERGVGAVQLSGDAGKTWQAAQVKTPNTPNVWSLWVAQWVPEARGSLRLMVRAVDGTGEVQVATPAPPFPDGSSGLHAVTVTV